MPGAPLLLLLALTASADAPGASGGPDEAPPGERDASGPTAAAGADDGGETGASGPSDVGDGGAGEPIDGQAPESDPTDGGGDPAAADDSEPTPSADANPDDPDNADPDAAPPTDATPAHLAGVVLERGSGLPVAATVTVGGVEVPVDDRGRFAVDLPAGDHVVAVTSFEHLPFEATESLDADEALEVVYRIERRSWDGEITVYGEAAREEVSRRVVTADELRRIPGSFGDPIRALQSLPGVARPSSVEGDLVVRGAEALNTGTYIDEVPIPYLFHFFVGRSVVNSALLDDVEFFAGGMPSRFGDVTQSVVNARTLDTTPDPGLHGRVSVDLLDFSVSGEGRLSDHWTWQAGYRLSWIGGIIGLSARTYAVLRGFGDQRPGYPTIAYQDHLLRLAYDRGPDRVVLTVLGARDALAFHPPEDTGDPLPIEEPELPYDPWRFMDSGFQRVHLRWDRKEGAREQITWFAVGPDHELSLLEGIGLLGDGVEFGKLSGWTVMARREDRFGLSDTVALRTGADTRVEPVRVEDYKGIDADGNVPTTSDVRVRTGAWGEVQVTAGRTFVAPGVRVNAHAFNDLTAVVPEPRLTLRHTLDDTWTATGFVGRFSQAPPADRYADGIGDPSIGLMRAWQASTGVEGRWPSGVEVDATVYASHTDGLVVKDQVVESVLVDPAYPDAGYTTAIRPTFRAVTGTAFGFEGLLRARPNGGRWFGWVALGAGRALRRGGSGRIPGDYDLPLSLTVVGAYDLPLEISLSGRFRVTSGYPYTPLHGVHDVQFDAWQGLQGAENSARFPVFRQLDLRVDRTWTADRARWTLYLDAHNVLNTKNYFLATYTPNYAELVPLVWVPIIPTLGVEVAY